MAGCPLGRVVRRPPAAATINMSSADKAWVGPRCIGQDHPSSPSVSAAEILGLPARLSRRGTAGEKASRKRKVADGTEDTPSSLPTEGLAGLCSAGSKPIYTHQYITYTLGSTSGGIFTVTRIGDSRQFGDGLCMTAKTGQAPLGNARRQARAGSPESSSNALSTPIPPKPPPLANHPSTQRLLRSRIHPGLAASPHSARRPTANHRPSPFQSPLSRIHQPLDRSDLHSPHLSLPGRPLSPQTTVQT